MLGTSFTDYPLATIKAAVSAYLAANDHGSLAYIKEIHKFYTDKSDHFREKIQETLEKIEEMRKMGEQKP